MHQFSKRPTVIHIHLQVKGGLLVRQVAEVGAVELLGKATSRYLRYHQGLGLLGEALEEFYYLTKGDMMGYWTVAVLAVCLRQYVEAIKLAMVLFALQACYHLVNKVVNVEQFQFYTGVVDGVRQVVSKGIAEGGHSTVVVGAAPLAKQIREAVYQYLGARLATIL